MLTIINSILIHVKMQTIIIRYNYLNSAIIKTYNSPSFNNIRNKCHFNLITKSKYQNHSNNPYINSSNNHNITAILQISQWKIIIVIVLALVIIIFILNNLYSKTMWIFHKSININIFLLITPNKASVIQNKHSNNSLHNNNLNNLK